MSLTPNPNVPAEPQIIETSTLPRWVILLFVAFALVGYLFYTNYNDRQAARASLDAADKKAQAVDAEFGKTNARIAELQAKFDVHLRKLGLYTGRTARARGLAATIKKDQQEPRGVRQQLAAERPNTPRRNSASDHRISGTKTDVAATKADLEATKSKLQSTVGDLGVQSGLIARNHDEVEELKRLGERDIFEFSLKKEKTPQHVGPIQVVLRNRHQALQIHHGCRGRRQEHRKERQNRWRAHSILCSRRSRTLRNRRLRRRKGPSQGLSEHP